MNKDSEAYQRHLARNRDRYQNDPEFRERKLEQMSRYRTTAAFMLSKARHNARRRSA